MKKKFFVVLIMIMLVLFTGCSFGKKTEENKDVSVRYDGDDIIYKTKVNENTNMVKVYVNIDQAVLIMNEKEPINVFTSAGVYEQEWDDKARNSDIYFLKVGGYTDYRWVAQSNDFVDSRIGESEIFANGSFAFKITSPIDFILNYKDDESLDGTAYINSLLDKVFKEYTSKIENTEIENISKEDSNRDRVIGEEEENEKENNFNSVTSFVENNLGRTISQYEYEHIKVYIQEYSEPIVLKAYQIAFEQNKTSLSYVKGILQNWRDCGLDTLEKINEDLKTGKKSTNERKLEKIFAGIDWGRDKHESK